MEWKTHGERQVYTNKWVNLCLVDVQQPDGRRWEYHVVRLRHLAVAAVVNDQQEVLMMWRHRFITDSWAWELPMGLVEEGSLRKRRRPAKYWRRLAGLLGRSSP